MFSSCSSLQTVPLFDTAKVTIISGMFGNCSSLQAIPFFNFSAVTTVSQPFQNCNNLKQAATQVPNAPWDVSNLNLSPEAINQVFAALPTGAAFARTCTITNNWGEPFCNRSIATAKGWRVEPIR
jgi:surface protein